MHALPSARRQRAIVEAQAKAPFSFPEIALERFPTATEVDARAPRRSALRALGALTLATLPSLSRATRAIGTSPGKAPRVCVLFWGPPEYASKYFAPHFLAALAELGYTAP